jgi:hypothetical protein
MGRSIINIVFIVFIAGNSLASPIDSLKRKVFEEHTLIYPRIYKPFQCKTAFSILFTNLPIDWVETSVDVPIFQVESKIGLPAGFSMNGSLQTIVVSNQLRIGPHWNYSLGKISFSTGFDVSFMYGRMTVAGFNNEATGWATHPIASIGISTGNVAFTVSGEINKLVSMRIKSGDAEVSKEKNFQSGYTLSLYMEQRLWKNHVMILGLINNFQKFFYPVWPAFSAFNRMYYIPQVYIGLVL